MPLLHAHMRDLREDSCSPSSPASVLLVSVRSISTEGSAEDELRAWQGHVGAHGSGSAAPCSCKLHQDKLTVKYASKPATLLDFCFIFLKQK